MPTKIKLPISIQEYIRKVSYHPHTYDDRPCPPCGDFDGCHRLGKGLPPIVCLCGSTRFKDVFVAASMQLSIDGFIVVSVGAFPHAVPSHEITTDQKLALDELHKRKIDLADVVFVLNVDGYVGESTRSEVEYAQQEGKRVVWLEGTEQETQ